MNTMPKHSLFTLIALGAILFACSDGDKVNPFLGTWQLTEFTLGSALDNNRDGTASTNLVEELPCFSSVLSLNEDSTWMSNSIGILIGTDLEGVVVSFACLAPTEATGTWTQPSKNTLNFGGNTFTIDGDRMVSDVFPDPDAIFIGRVYERVVE